MPLTLPTQLLDSRHETAPDVSVTDHPLFRVLAGRRNGFLPLVLVDYYYAVRRRLEAARRRLRECARPTCATTRRWSSKRRFGKGRVVAQLTKLSTGDTPLGRWTNWSLNPIFPVLANELVAYLAAGQQNDSAPTRRRRPGRSRARRRSTIRRFASYLPGDGTTRPEVPIDATLENGQLTAQAGERARRAASTKCSCSRGRAARAARVCVQRAGRRRRSARRPAR